MWKAGIETIEPGLRRPEADGGVENRACRGFDVGDMEGALLYAVGQNMRELIAETFLVRPHHLARLLRQGQIGREHLGVFANPLVFGCKQRAQPTLKPGRRRPRPFRYLLKRRVDTVEPALRDRVAQRSLARKMTV